MPGLSPVSNDRVVWPFDWNVVIFMYVRRFVTRICGRRESALNSCKGSGYGCGFPSWLTPNPKQNAAPPPTKDTARLPRMLAAHYCAELTQKEHSTTTPDLRELSTNMSFSFLSRREPFLQSSRIGSPSAAPSSFSIPPDPTLPHPTTRPSMISAFFGF